MKIFYAKIDIPLQLSSLDWLVFVGACCLCAALITYGHRKKSTLQILSTQRTNSVFEYLLMGRQLTLPLFVATLVVSWYGNIFGVTQIAFEQGIYNLFTQGIFWYISYIFFALYLVKKIRAYDAITLPEVVKKIYGAKSAKLTAILMFFKTLPITYAISIGLFIQCLFPLSLMHATLIGVCLIVLYVLSGGLRSIVYSDVALFIIMCVGVASVLIFSVLEFGGWRFLRANLPDSYFTPCGTNTLATTVVWLFIAASTTFISPAFYQRCLAASNDKVAIRGILISTAIWFLFDICTTFGAMYAKASIPQADSLYAYVTYGVQLLPAGFKGLFLASMAAAIIATLDSFLYIASNILLYDLPIFKFSSIKLQHIFAVVLTAALTIVISLMFKGKIENSWLLLKSYFSACLLLPILLGYFFPLLANDKLFITNCVVACLSLTMWQIFFKSTYPNIDSFYIGCIATCIVFAGYYLKGLGKTPVTEDL